MRRIGLIYLRTHPLHVVWIYIRIRALPENKHFVDVCRQCYHVVVLDLFPFVLLTYLTSFVSACHGQRLNVDHVFSKTSR